MSLGCCNLEGLREEGSYGGFLEGNRASPCCYVLLKGLGEQGLGEGFWGRS